MILLNRRYWKVGKTKEKGRGLFLIRDINAGVVVGDYLGKVVKTSEFDIKEDEHNLYLMYYHDKASIYPDLKKDDIHLVNHSCVPNLFMYILHGHTLFFSLRRIFAGEELTVSYMLSPQDDYCKPCLHICKCESLLCLGTMHLSALRYEEWNRFKKVNAKKSKRLKVKFGSDLAPLSIYPDEIADNPIYTLFGYGKVSSYKCNNDKLKSLEEIRGLIRKSGRTLEFSKLNLKVYGVVDGVLFSEVLLNC